MPKFPKKEKIWGWGFISIRGHFLRLAKIKTPSPWGVSRETPTICIKVKQLKIISSFFKYRGFPGNSPGGGVFILASLKKCTLIEIKPHPQIFSFSGNFGITMIRCCCKKYDEHYFTAIVPKKWSISSRQKRIRNSYFLSLPPISRTR